MEITVIGSSGPYPRPGGACSGYLIQEGETKILIDCGNGILSRLSLFVSLNEIDAIILTHLHSDHISDIMVLRYAIALNKSSGIIEKSIPLYAPTEPKETLDTIQFMDAFVLNSLDENTILEFGDMKFTFKSMNHGIPTYGVTIENGTKKFVYSSDTKLCDAISEISKDADLFLCECTLLDKDLNEEVFHLSAKQVGEIAESNNVKKLLLIHIWPEYPLDEVLNEAKTLYSGNIGIAEEFTTYQI